VSEQSLIQRNDTALTVTYTTEAIALKESALALSGVVGKVTNAEENASAVAAQAELHKIRTLAEKARKAAKEPVLEYGRKIDGAAREFDAELLEEMTRVSKLIGDFQTLEQAKARASEQLRQQELDKIERDKAGAIAKATSHEQVEAIQERANQEAQQFTAAPSVPIRADGQVVKTDWSIIVENQYDLAKYHPNCVTITPKLTEIKAMLNEGMTLRGIKAEKVVKASVRVTTQKAVEV